MHSVLRNITGLAVLLNEKHVHESKREWNFKRKRASSRFFYINLNNFHWQVTAYIFAPVQEYIKRHI